MLEMKKQTLVGLIFGFFVVLALLLAVGYWSNTQARSFRYVIMFNNAKNIQVGDRVVYRGVAIGEVKKFEFRGERVAVTVQIEPEHSQRVQAGSTAIIADNAWPNVSGKKVVEIHNPEDPGPPLEKGTIVEGKDSLLDLKAWQLGQKVDRWRRQANKTLDEVGQQIEQLRKETKEYVESPEFKSKVERLRELADELKTASKEKYESLRERYEKLRSDSEEQLTKLRDEGKNKGADLLERALSRYREALEGLRELQGENAQDEETTSTKNATPR